ncbi:MAG: pilus assembly protein PilM [Planctomycetaceae bacterium]
MSDLIALHWGFDEITAVVPKGRGVRAVTLRKQEGVDADPTTLGRWLKGELATQRISAKRATVVLPRSAAIFRKLTLPDLPDDELPDVVRMQAATKSPTPLDRLRLDFIPLPRRGEGREALLATVAGKTIDDALAAVRTAGLEPFSVGLSPFGTAAKLAGNEPTLIVAVQEQTAEITLVRGGSVLFSHATDLPGGEPDEDRQWLTSEISRAVVAADHLEAAGGIARIVLVGPSNLLEPLAAPLEERYGGKAELIDAPAKIGMAVEGDGVDVAALAAAAGQLEAGGPPRLDFLNPRKRIEKPDRRRLHIGLAVGGVVAALLAAYGVSWMKQAELQDEIAMLNSQSGDLAQKIKLAQPTVDAMKAIDAWSVDQAETGELLAALDAALPGTERLYLTELDLEPAGRNDLGRINGKGAARSRFDVEALNDALAAKGYRVTPPAITTSARDPEYPHRFDLILTIPLPKPATSTATSAGGANPAGTNSAI